MDNMNAENMELEGEINGLKQLLKQTDYMALKFIEGKITESEFEEIKKTRQGYRDKINELEAKLNKK